MQTRRWFGMVILGVMVGAGLAGSASQVQADPMPAVTFVPPATGEQLGNGPFTLGWSFTANQDIVVSALGVFDQNNNLVESHPVGLWDSTGNLLGSATVPSGSPVNQIGQFDYVSLSSPISLQAGHTYTIGAVWDNGTDNMIFPGTLAGQGSSLVTNPDITFGINQYIAGGSLADPTNTTGDTQSYFGPNFLIGTVPEPSSLALFGLGGLALAGWRRWRKRQQAQA